MVFICFPKDETDEETSLRRKYEKLKRKRASLTQLKSTKPEPQVVHSTLTLKKSAAEVGAKDANKVIEKLKRSGALPQIRLPERRPVGSGFKRKIAGGASSSETILSNRALPSDEPPSKTPLRLFKPPSRAPNINGSLGISKTGEGKVEQKWSAIAGRKDDGSIPNSDLNLKRELVSYDDDIF